MKLLKIIFAFAMFAINYSSYAQKQTFDVVSFVAPKGWQQTQNEGGIQLAVTDKKTGAYALAVITKATASNLSANENFMADWNKLVKKTVQVNDEPAMQQPINENGWDIVSGQANFTDGASNGLATLLTATSNGQMVSVVLMTNTQQYQNDLLALINSLELAKVAPNTNNNQVTTSNANKSSIVGLWVYYTVESNGYYNGFPQVTGGYMRREYAFYPDGTYLYRVKNWMVYMKDILFVYESGTWAVSGNKLTITPKQGKGGWWNKAASGRTSEWGSPAKTSTWKLEPITYTFDFHYYSGTNETSLVLTSSKQTEREGKQENNESIYSPRAFDKTLIDNPPGLKTGFENKSLTAVGAKTTTQQPTVASNTPASEGSNISNSATAAQLQGIWGQYQSESYAGAGGNNNLTAGYDWREYYFNPDGTYEFLQKNISYLYQNEIVLAYEKGTYKLNGNQLTVSPKSGTVESWSKAGSDKAGKLLKTEKRTLEAVTYMVDFHYFSGIQKTNLVLQYNKQTVRDGAFSNNATFKNSWLYARPYHPNKPEIELPTGTKIDFKYKPATASITSEAKKEVVGVATNSPLTGKIWEGTTTEKFANSGGTSFNTGGFSTNQYRFNADGTYRFVNVLASHYTDSKMLGYETGTWSLNGNQLTVIPTKGYNEEWSKIGKTSNGNSDVTNRAINETWNKKLKTSSRKLEKYTYTFSVGKNGDKTSLVLQRSSRTEREGEGSVAYLNETAPEKSVKLPNGMS